MTIKDPLSTSRLNPSSGGVGSTAGSKRSAGAGRVTSGGGKATLDRDGQSDNISLSNLSRQLQNVASPSSSQRVDQISREYSQGSYSVNAMATSQGIVREAAMAGF